MKTVAGVGPTGSVVGPAIGVGATGTAGPAAPPPPPQPAASVMAIVASNGKAKRRRSINTTDP
jgi:hypothetical protein